MDCFRRAVFRARPAVPRPASRFWPVHGSGDAAATGRVTQRSQGMRDLPLEGVVCAESVMSTARRVSLCPAQRLTQEPSGTPPRHPVLGSSISERVKSGNHAPGVMSSS